MDFIEIKINSWEKYNARRDVKKNWWFKLSNGVFDDPDMRGLSNAGFRAWVYCLSLASKRGSSNVRVYFAELSKTCHLSRKNSLSLFERLESLKIISVTNSYRTRDERVLNPVPRGEERRGEEKRGEERKSQSSTSSTPPALPVLIKIWNDNCGEKLAKVIKSNASRNKLCGLRIKDHSEVEWAEIIKKVSKSRFLTGSNDRGWKATFDWILRSDSDLRVLEGKYDSPPDGVGGLDFSWMKELEDKEQKQQNEGKRQ